MLAEVGTSHLDDASFLGYSSFLDLIFQSLLPSLLCPLGDPDLSAG